MLRRLTHYRPPRKGLVLLVLLLPALALLTFYQTYSSPPAFVLDHPYFQYDLDVLEPRDLDGQRCVLPRVHPFDASIWGVLTPPKNIVCSSRKSYPISVTDDGWLRFNHSQLRADGYGSDSPLKCHWSRVERGGVPGNVDEVVSYGEESPLPREGLKLPPDVEILRVVCRNYFNFAVYDRLYARIRDVQPFPPATPRPAGNFVNVLIFGLDSMSRLAFIRHLPLTYRYLTEELKMTVLRGMNKVGDNTYPNLIPLLTGKAAYGGDLPNSSKGFDDWPLIWKNYSRYGYATLWAEDLPQYALFNYLEVGFRDPPTLHYLRPFWLAMEESSLLKISSHFCYGNKPRYLLQLEYLSQFISVYGSKGIPYFGFSFLAELSHDYISKVSSADVHFRDFFQWLADSGQLDNTLLFVMSDHGHRFDVIRTTKVGQIEERTPFHAVRIPMTLKSRQPKILANLLANGGRLVTPFDVYATLEDLLGFVESGRPLGISPPSRGILGVSLFGQVPENRTCKDASVPGHFCICETATEIDKSDTRVRSAARVIVDHVNQLLRDEGDKCSRLTLGDVVTSQLVKTMEEEDGNKQNPKEQKVRVVVEVQPSLALFEATVILQEGATGEVWGEVSRINPYAGQDSCIRHAILRKYCFCLDQNTERDVVKL